MSNADVTIRLVSDHNLYAGLEGEATLFLALSLSMNGSKARFLVDSGAS